MFPALTFVQALGSSSSEFQGCDIFDEKVAIAGKKGLKILSCDGTLSDFKTVGDPIATKCNAVSLSHDFLLAGFDDGIRKITLSEPNSSVHIHLQAKEGKQEAKCAISCISKALDGQFAFAVGCYVYKLLEDSDTAVLLGSLPDEPLQLHWVKAENTASCLVARTGKGCYLWPNNTENDSFIELLCDQGASKAFAAAANSPFVACACDGSVVKCWKVADIIKNASSSEAASSPPPLILDCYDAGVNCMEWCCHGRYLATSDGSDCTIWDFPEDKDASISANDSVMCCGHDPATHIIAMSFQPEGGHFLATLSNTGKLAIFDTRGFRRGGVAGPCATARLEEEAELTFAQLLWLPNNQLLVCAPGISLLLYAIGAAEGAEDSTPVLAGELANLSVENTPIEQACVEYISSPLTPPKNSPETMDSTELVLENSGSGNSATEAPTPANEEPLALKNRPSPIRTSPPPPAADEAAPSSTRERSTTASACSKPSSSSSGGGRGGGRMSNTPGGRNGNPHHHRQSPYHYHQQNSHTAQAGLLEHIQHLRDAPADRSSVEQQEGLTGWGLGVSGGSSIPWMAAAAGHGGMTAVPYGAVPVVSPQYVQQYQQHAAAMAAMAAAQGQGMGMSPPGAIPMQYGYISGGAATMSSPRSPAGSASSGAPASPYLALPPRNAGPSGGGAPMMISASPTAMVMTPQGPAWQAAALSGGGGGGGYNTTDQTAQQWAGLAPGYMAYQHGATYAMPASQPVYNKSPRSSRELPPQQRQQYMQQQQPRHHHEGSSGMMHSKGSSSLPPSSSEKESELSDKFNSSSQKSSKKSRNKTNSSGSSVGMSADADAAIAAVEGNVAPMRRNLSGSSGGGGAGGSRLSRDSSLNKDHQKYSSETSSLSAPSPRRLTNATAANSSPPDSSATIYVGNLPPVVDEYAIAWTCAHFGPVAHAQIIRDKNSQVSKGFGFVTFAHPAYATIAIQQLNGQVMYGPFAGQKIKAGPTNKRYEGEFPSSSSSG